MAYPPQHRSRHPRAGGGGPEVGRGQDTRVGTAGPEARSPRRDGPSARFAHRARPEALLGPGRCPAASIGRTAWATGVVVGSGRGIVEFGRDQRPGFVEPVRPGSRPRRRVAGRARAASTRPRPRRGGPAWPMGVVGSGTPLGHADFACRRSSRCRCAGCIRQACRLDDRKPPCSRRHFTFLGGRVLHPERYRRGGCGHTAGRGSDGGDDAWPRAVPDRRWSAPPGHRTRECSPRPREGPPPSRWV